METYIHIRSFENLDVSITLPFCGSNLDNLEIEDATQFMFGKQTWTGADIRKRLPNYLQNLFDETLEEAVQSLKLSNFVPPWMTLEEAEANCIKRSGT